MATYGIPIDSALNVFLLAFFSQFFQFFYTFFATRLLRAIESYYDSRKEENKRSLLIGLTFFD